MKTSIFRTADGRNHAVTFALVSSLFFLWALCNGMIDVMDKHFQDFLHLTKSQSAWVQFAHYLGYFLMALPAGWLARKLGYKGGIIAGLGIVALGCLWFIPATGIEKFWAFLLGVCVISMGLTFLETIANPYTTVLGAPEYAATRINLAQTCNGVGWIAGPIVGGMFFYSEKGAEAANETLWIPYAVIAGIVILLALVFVKAKVPDLSGLDAYHVADNEEKPTPELARASHNTTLIYSLMLLNVVVLSLAVAMIAIAIAGVFKPSDTVIHWVFGLTVAIPSVAGAVWLAGKVRRITIHSVWVHPHFPGATLAQFFYVAAQAGIFAFFINYMIAEIPALPESMKDSWIIGGASGSELRDGAWFVTEKGATKLLAYIGFVLFVIGRFSGSGILKKYAAHKVLGLYGFANTILMLIIVLKVGWLSAAAVFLSFFFMSIMFPTIFALGIYGLGEKAKIASSFIVMAIMGGAILPKIMGWFGDKYNMSVGFIVPMFCFLVVALYGSMWSKLSGSQGLVGVKSGSGH